MKRNRVLLALAAGIVLVAAVLYAAYPYVYVKDSASGAFTATFPGAITGIQCYGNDADAQVRVFFKTGATSVQEYPHSDSPTAYYKTYAGVPFTIEWSRGWADAPDSVVVVVTPDATTDYEILAR